MYHGSLLHLLMYAENPHGLRSNHNMLPSTISKFSNRIKEHVLKLVAQRLF
jgi:hypothetical protein